MYLPLPESLTIKNSSIHGLGLFCVTRILANALLGKTHIKDTASQDGWERTPLGGFYNHSETPNCTKVSSPCGTYMFLQTLREIEPGEEITVSYTLYAVKILG